MTKDRIVNILKNKFVAGIFAFALVVLGMGLFTEANEVQATETTTSTVAFKSELLEVSDYFDEDGNRIAPKPKQGQGYDDWIFAGWYKEAECKTAMNSKKGERWAKFVPSEVLSVKCQVTAESVEDPTSSLRLVSTVDSLRYSKVGFEVTYGFGAESLDIDTTNVYQRIESAFEGQEYGFSPNIFDLQSEYFITATLTNIGSDYYDDGFFIKPYWVTLDGTKVYGVSRYARVEDSYLNIVNVPVRLYSDESVAGGNVVVDYSGLTSRDGSAASFALYSVDGVANAGYDVGDIFSSVTVTDDATNKQVTCTLPEGAEAKADGMLVNLRFKMQVEKAVLPKTNAFGVTANLTKADSQVANVVVSDVVYNYYHTEYTNNPDTSWYDSSKTEFVITTPDELYGLAQLVNEKKLTAETVYLGSDITVNAETIDPDAEDWATVSSTLKAWTPIGAFTSDYSYSFQGTFDGQIHTISGLYCDRTEATAVTSDSSEKPTWCAGLFAMINTESEVKNVRVTNSYFKASDYAGGIVGWQTKGTIKNCYTDVTAEITGTAVGGITGSIRGGSIEECWFDGSAICSGTGWIAGGIAGFVDTLANDTIIEINNCVNTGDVVSGVKDIGGIVGRANLNITYTDCGVEITNCISACSTISGTQRVGGILGSSQTQSTGSVNKITNCVSMTVVSGTTANQFGTIVGYKYGGNLEFTNIHAVQTDSVPMIPNNTTITGGNKSYTEVSAVSDYYAYDAIDKLTGLEFDFDNIWATRQSNTPVLNSWCESGALYNYDVEWAGSGTEEDPWIIKTPQELYGLAKKVDEENTYSGKFFKLGANITVNSGTASAWEDSAPKYNWLTIGEYVSDASKSFQGSFDGANYTVKGLYTPGGARSGMFIYPQNCTIKNLKLTNSYIKGNEGTGGIAGWYAGGTFDTIYSDAIVKAETTAGAKANHGGGLFALLNGATTTVNNCWFDGEVSGKQFVGGITSYTGGAGIQITNCLNTGTVSASTEEAGGIAGRVSADVTIQDCLNTGMITATEKESGGIIGQIYSGTATANRVYVLSSSNSVAVGNGSVSGSVDMVDDVTGANGYLETYLIFDRHEEHLPENEQHDGDWVARTNDVPTLKIFADAADVMELTNQNTYRGDTRWYDGNEDATSYTINTAEELVGLEDLTNEGTSFEGKEIYLGADIVINAGKASDWYAGSGEAKLYNWIPIGNGDSIKFLGTFDGKGHTITGIYAEHSADGIGLFGRIADGSTVRDFKITNSYISGKSGVGSVCGWWAGGTIDTIYSDAYIVASSDHSAGIAALVNDGTTVRNCWYAGTLYGKTAYNGGIISYCSGAGVVIEHCLNTGNLTGSSEVGGIVGRSNASFTIRECLNAGTISPIANSERVGAVIGWPNAGTVVCENVYAAGTSLAVYPTQAAKADGTTAIAEGSATGTIEAIDDLTGANGYLNTYLTFDRPELPTPTIGYWVAITDDTPVLKSFANADDIMTLDGQNMYRADTRWYDEETTSFAIDTVEELIGFASLVNSGTTFKEKTVTLGADITVNKWDAEDWNNAEVTAKLYNGPVIGDYGWHSDFSVAFEGTFDGAGYDVKGLYIDKSGYSAPKNTASNTIVVPSSWCAGLFGRTYGATVQNVNVLNSYIKGAYYAAGIVGEGNLTTIQDVYTDAIISATSGNSGGITGRISGGTVKNAWFDGEITAVNMVGGISGIMTSNGDALPSMEDCLVTGKVTSTQTGNNAYIGGLTGIIQSNASITDCLVDAESITASNKYCVGSVIGEIDATYTATVTNTYALDGRCSSLITDAVGTHATKTVGTVSADPVVSEDLDNYKGYMNTNLDFDNAWVAKTNSAPRLQYFTAADDVNIFDTTSWYTKAVADGDGNAAGTEANPYIIDSLADLYGLSKRVNSGKTFAGEYIKLTESITANEGNPTDDDWANTAPYYEWTPIGNNTNLFKGNFDGGMNTISGLYTLKETVNNNKAYWYIGLFGIADSATIKNVRVEDSYFQAAYYVGGIIGWITNGKIASVYSNATTVATTGNAAVIVGAIDGGTIQNAWSDGNATAPSYAGGITSFATNSESAVQHCLNTGTINATSSQAGGIVSRAASTLVTIDDCLSVGTVTAPSNRGTILGYMPSPPTDSETKEYTTTYVTTITSSYGYSDSSVPNSASTAIGVVKDGSTATGGEKITSLAAIYDLGAFGTQVHYTAVKDESGTVTTPAYNLWSERLDYNYWTARIGDIPVPTVFADADGYQIDTSWYSEDADSYSIENVADFYGLALLSQTNNFSGKTISLANDIVINTTDVTTEDAKVYEWLPIGDTKCAFAGTFEGNAHTISGLYRMWKSSDTLSWIGLFESTADTSIVRDFSIRNSYFGYDGTADDPTRIGSVAGEGYGTFDSIYSDATIESFGRGTGGLIGTIGANGTTATITNCWYSGTATGTKPASSAYIGGIAGLVSGSATVTIKHCLVSGEITAYDKRAGGLCGTVSGSIALTLTDNLITAKVSATSHDDSTDSQYEGVAIGSLEGTASAIIANTFGINDYAPSGIGINTSTGTVTGMVYTSAKANRLIGYAGAWDTDGNYFGLDFDGTTATDDSGFSGWSFVKGSTPVLTYFVGDTTNGKIVSTDNTCSYSVATVDGLLELDYWTNNSVSATFSSAEDKGSGNYLITLSNVAYASESTASYKGYLADLVADDSIFAAYGNDNGLNSAGVYNAIFTSKDKGDDINKDWVVTTTFVGSTTGTGTVYISVSMGQPLSTHLKASDVANVDYTTTDNEQNDGYTATKDLDVTFHMLEEKYYSASSYIIQLENGHFIIIDGGIDSEAEELFAYLESLVPEEGKKPIVEAWIISHGHLDHCGTLQTLARYNEMYKNEIKDSEGNIRGRDYENAIYVEGIYFNEPSTYVTTTYDNGHYPFIGGIKDAAEMFKTTGGSHPEIYRMQTGQRYTFDTVVMDIMLAQEQITLAEYASTKSNPGDAFNESSTWTLFTINGKKLLTAGDGSEASKNKIVDMYEDTEFMTVDVFTGLHHGKNINRLNGTGTEWTGYTSWNDDFSNALTVDDVVLFPYKYDVTIENSTATTGPTGQVGGLVAARTQVFLDKMTNLGKDISVTYESADAVQTDGRYFYFGQGTSVLTFGDDGISVKVLTKIYTDTTGEETPDISG